MHYEKLVKSGNFNVFDEFIKCRDDFVYFVEKYIKIIHPTKGITSFQLYDFQKRLIKEYDENQFVIGVKFRQGGFTTTTIAYLLWRCMFNSDQKVLMISKTDREARDLGKVVDRIIDGLPSYLKPLLSRRNDHTKEFAVTGSRMQFSAPQACCGIALNYLFVDEAAFIPDMDQWWHCMYPTLSTGGKCFVLSTTNGIGNWFEETYTRTVERKNKFKVFECSYKEHPDYNNAEWVAQMRKNLGEKGFMQEVMGYFLVPEAPKKTKKDLLDRLEKLLDEFE